MFQAVRRITDSLAHKYVGESAFDRAIRKSFLGMLCVGMGLNYHDVASLVSYYHAYRMLQFLLTWLTGSTQISWTSMKNTIGQKCRRVWSLSIMPISVMPRVE